MADGPHAGARSDVPRPRPRTPSPVRAVAECKKTPAPPRDFDLTPDTIDVIYAEDEEVFRETAVRELLKVGFLRQNIREANNGLEALEHLAKIQTEGNLTKPVMVLLDVRMPGMDGRECALKIQEMVKQKQLRREPYVICISSIARQVEVDEGGGNFQIVLPKPINVQYIEDAFDHLRKWWTLGLCRQLPAWKTFDIDKIDLLAADDEPLCRMSAQMAFNQAGVLTDSTSDAESKEEMLEQLVEGQVGDASRPWVLLLSSEEWARIVYDWVEEQRQMQSLRRAPFVICTSVDSERMCSSASNELFHVFLPRNFGQEDVKWSLDYCRLWWLTRSVEAYSKPSEGQDAFSDAGSDQELSDEEIGRAHV